jgi:murein DD-endopeptidase MepM/ murein hydrolase activator NlpD
MHDACPNCGASLHEVHKAQRAEQFRRARWMFAGLTLLGAGYAPHEGPQLPPSAVPKAVMVAPVQAKDSVVEVIQHFGPHWPPSSADWWNDLAQDAWIHPLPGPVRRMPKSDQRIFGAERPGIRPPECRHGHCGVDLGGEIWGEHVFASHDGVVDRVQRGPNDEHGGMYVRLAHRGGTVFTQYFHLAAIARGLAPGVQVKAGDVIGLLGDSGVKESTAHLHFTVSVRPSSEWPEQYMDPEPLVALWPLKIPIQGTVEGLVTTMSPVTPPLGLPPHKRKATTARAKPVTHKRPATDAAPAEAPAASAPSAD